MSKRFARVAAESLGVAGVRMYHDQALYKEPGGGPTPWHQDQFYWPLDTDKTVTMWMPLVNIHESGGTLTFAPGSQCEGCFGALPISRQSDQVFKNFLSERGHSTRTYGAMRAGDATFHTGWTLHAAPGNPSQDFLREVMTVTYISDDAHVTQPNHKAHEFDLASWMPGLQPGDLAASPLNPLQYSSN